MRDIVALLENWPFAVWALGLAGAGYYAISKGTGHLSEDNRARLALYLQGDYRGSWAEGFCDLFDAVFGTRHFSVKTFLRSAMASVLAVATIYALFGPVLGVLDTRSGDTMTVLTALAIGAAINILPDYLSLWETRALLSLFRRVRHPLLQLGVMILDVVISGLIIWLGIAAFLWITGRPPISWVEMVAVYSPFAVFFYSTFLTSFFAWAYCLSSWFVKGFAGLGLNRLLNMDAPGKSLAITASVLLFGGAMAVKPVLSTEEDGWAQMDALLCEYFPREACTHAARLAEDDQIKLEFLTKGCAGGWEECSEEALSRYGIRDDEAAALWRAACDAGHSVSSCSRLGYMYEKGYGVELNEGRAVSLYERGCDGDDARGCSFLGAMYETGHGVSQDYERAVALYRQGCEGGNALGCTSLGYMYENGLGVTEDDERATELYQHTCEEGFELACSFLAKMYQMGLGVAKDQERAAVLYDTGCNAGLGHDCTELGYMYADGLGVVEDLLKASRFFEEGCNNGDAAGCTALGIMYSDGLGVEQDHAQAIAVYQRGCNGGSALGCRIVGALNENGIGLAQDLREAERLYLQACKMGDEWSCEKMETFKDVPK